MRGVTNAEAIHNKSVDCHESLRDSRNDKSFVDCHDFASAKSRNDECNESSYKSHDNSIRFTPKFYFILGTIFNLSLLGFFKYTDFLLENFNAFSKLAHLDFDIPLPHILLPLALSFVTFQQIAFLFDCYKRTKGELNENLHIDFVDYALFISFFPQLIAGPIVHHREMMPQFAKMSNSSSGNHCANLLDFESSQTLQSSSLPKSSKNSTSTTANTRIGESAKQSLLESTQCVESKQSTKSKHSPSLAEGARGWVESQKDNAQPIINYEFLSKGIFIFSIGLFKKVFIADSFAKWANAGFGVVEQGGVLNIAESWATSLSYTFQLYFDFSGYCDMAMGLALMFGIVLPLNFDSPYKSLNIAEFWRRWHITLGRFLRECLYIPLGGNRVSKILNLRNLFIVAFLSGIWHGAGWGFVIWGVLHGVAMVIHRIYSWILERLVKFTTLCHTECSEVSKSRESNQTKDAMTQKRIDESHRFTQSKQIANDSKVAKMDSSLHASRSAQNDGVKSNHDLCGSIFGRFCGFSSARRGNRTNASIDEAKREESRKSVTQRVARRKPKQKKTSALYKFLCWFITFNFINIAWIFFRAENLNGALNLIKGMFGFANVEIPHKWSKIFSTLQGGTNEIIIWIVCAFIVCLALKNSFEKLQNFSPNCKNAIFTAILTTIALCSLLKNDYSPFLYFNF